MENPSTWDRLSASIAAAGLRDPHRTWAFLVVQGLVNDQPGDRSRFVQIAEHERDRVIIGPSASARVAGWLHREGISRLASQEPDPLGEQARARLATISVWSRSGE